MESQAEDIQALLAEALAARTADAILADVIFPAMRSVVESHVAGERILADVLPSAELVHRSIEYLRPTRAANAGTILVATVAGDVHHVGKALLVIILSACGYAVVDLGSQVPVERIVNAAIEQRPDAIGLSALLVTTSRQMSVCIQRLDARGVHVPVLVGGAAINRAFGRRSGVLPGGRVYEPGVFYCRDVFEGLATLDALVDPARRAALVDRNRDEVRAELSASSAVEPPARDRAAAPGPRRDARVPRPPYWGTRKRAADLRDVWHGLDRNTLFRYHWGGYRASAETFQRLVRDVFEPQLGALTSEALEAGWLQAAIVSGYFACNADGDDLVIYAHPHAPDELTRLRFPRQADGERLCLADYFRSADSGQRDVVGLQAVTAGARAGEYIDELQRWGEYTRMLYVSGLAAATAEALADYAHNLARRDLGLPATQGLRFSWGYPACPDLDEQRKVLPLLRAEAEIGLTLSQSSNLDPEHSTAAIIVHHPEAKYFGVRGAAA
jgi:5-methyltetrahydrofolate--homocysteine methyltransferase